MVVAGLLMHAVNLGGSHYAQYLGMSAGVTALVAFFLGRKSRGQTEPEPPPAIDAGPTAVAG